MFLLQNAVNAAANAPGKDDSTLELFFGAMALLALAMTWAWLYFRTKKPVSGQDEQSR